MTSIIIFVVGFALGIIFSTIGFRNALRKDPEKFVELMRQESKTQSKKKSIPQMHFYIEGESGKFYAYSTDKNKFEGMSETPEELIQALCLKYPEHDIVVMYDE